jgi:peptidoglycan glycosyltransferase
MQRQIQRVGVGLVFAFLAVFLQLNYLQIFAAERIASNPANVRALLREYSIKRGDILTVDGKTVARSVSTGGRLDFKREYPRGSLFAQITGYYSVRYGRDRIERSFNDHLLGDAGRLSMQDIQDRLFGDHEQGENVVLTVHSELQEVARQALGDQAGAVVAIEPSSGKVRAMWNTPTFNPNPLASHDLKEATAHWESLRPDEPNSPLLSKVTSRSFPPGSTFKVITAAAALESGMSRDETFPDPVALDLPLTDSTIRNFSGNTCAGGGEISLFDALRVSCNTTFGQIGLDMPGRILRISEAFGFNQRIPFDVSTEPSGYPDIPDDEAPARAQAAIGQRDVATTPLQMAVVTAGIANGGRVARPRLVERILDPRGGVVRTFETETLERAISGRTAGTLTDMMVAVVENGTGAAAQIEGIQVAGKTGTAQTVEGASPHAWFIAFAPAYDPQLAVAVLVENGGSLGSEATGGAVAAPIAKQIFEAHRRVAGW